MASNYSELVCGNHYCEAKPEIFIRLVLNTGRVIYFCNTECRKVFTNFRSSEIFVPLSSCQVCGNHLDNSYWFFSLTPNKKIYFCSEQCRQKYAEVELYSLCR